jgi:chemotaxis protein histidine kinase CheA
MGLPQQPAGRASSVSDRTQSTLDNSPPRSIAAEGSGGGNSDPFQGEMLALFLSEASEWLDQIAAALQELEAGAAPPCAETLRRTIRWAATNLGGSAATIGLTEVEECAFALMFHLQAGDALPPRGATLSAAFVRLKTALDSQASPLPAPPPAASLPAGVPGGATPALDLQALSSALRELAASRAHSSHSIKETLESLAQQARNPQDRSAPAIDVGAIRRCLDEVAVLDERILDETGEQVPRIARGLSELKAGVNTPESLKRILQSVTSLRWTAEAAGAQSCMRLLDGLETFLVIAKRHHTSITADRFDAVNEQLGLALPTVEQWIAAARLHRAAVEQALHPAPPRPARPRKNITPI